MEENRDRVLPRLPVFAGSGKPAWQGLRVEGLVRHPVTLSLEDLERLPRWKLAQDFRCEEGWVAPDQRWEGARLADLLELSEPLPEARFVELSAGEFTVALTLEEAMEGGALMALKLNGAVLPQEHGGPCRLVLAGKACYYSVKWVDWIRVLADRPEETGKKIALGRIGQAT